MIITSPAVLWMKKKNGRENALNLNWYRNAHYMKLDKAKKAYKQLIKNQILALPKMGKIEISYSYYLRQKADLGNVHAILEKFFLDALVELGKIDDDNCEIIAKDCKEFIEYDRNNPRCIIEIKEVKNEP